MRYRKTLGCKALPVLSIQLERGFTIVELMIATTVFATVLLLVSVGIIHISNAYYKGLNSAATQNTSANALNTISQAMQLGAGSLSLQTDAASNLAVLCVGNQEFIFLPGTLVHHDTAASLSNVGLYQRQVSGSCDDPTTLASGGIPTDGQELLADNMRLAKLDVQSVSGGSGCTPGSTFSSGALCTISVTVAFGSSDDLFCDTTITGAGQPGNCAPGSPSFHTGDVANDVQNHPTTADIRCRTQADSRFCAVSALTTTVERRL